MTKPALNAAIREAERFLALAHRLRDASPQAGLLSGATRRASLDLTRALADLRRPSR